MLIDPKGHKAYGKTHFLLPHRVVCSSICGTPVSSGGLVLKPMENTLLSSLRSRWMYSAPVLSCRIWVARRASSGTCLVRVTVKPWIESPIPGSKAGEARPRRHDRAKGPQLGPRHNTERMLSEVRLHQPDPRLRGIQIASLHASISQVDENGTVTVDKMNKIDPFLAISIDLMCSRTDMSSRSFILY